MDYAKAISPAKASQGYLKKKNYSKIKKVSSVEEHGQTTSSSSHSQSGATATAATSGRS
jgi:hypothetical protein